MTAPSPERISALPRWAREHLATLQRERDDAVCTVAHYAADAAGKPADAWTDPYRFPKPVAEGGERVRFYLTPEPVTAAEANEVEARERWVDVRVVRYRGEPARLEVMGARSLVFRPGASNVATVDVER